MSSPTVRSLIVLAVAAMAVVTLGMVTMFQTHRTELLVGSTYVNPMHGSGGEKPHPSHGYGNQAAPSLPSSAHFYNQKAHPQKLLVGSFPVDKRQKHSPSPPHGYGNQAAGSLPAGAGFYNQKDAQSEKLLVGSYNVGVNTKANPAMGIGNQAAGTQHGINDVGTNIVFHGVHNEGGVHGAKKQHTKKGVVGSFPVNSQSTYPQPHQPHGFGNQAAGTLPPQAGFYNQKAHPQKLLVGSFPVDKRQKHSPSPPHGYGNQAAGSLPAGAGFYNQKDAQSEKLLVGSYNVGVNTKANPAMGIGNQAAGTQHGINDVGTNIVFHGVHNEGGVHGAKKQHTKKGVVGSFPVNSQSTYPQPHQPHGFGNQAAGTLPPQAGFYNQKAHPQKLMVGSFPVPHTIDHGRQMKQPHGYGNQAAGTMPSSAGFYNQ